jgi:predicted nucleic acid-binding protein
VTFVDSSFWIGLAVANDERHRESRALLASQHNAALVTSNLVRGEVWTLLRRWGGHASAVEFLDRLERTPRLRIEFVDEQLEREALRWLRRHDERPYSFVDATSFALMKRLRIKEALAFDGDFAAAGFVELRAT